MLRLLLVLLLALALYFPKIVFAHSQTQIIEMSPEGLKPNSVTVDQNSTIIFLNKDKDSRWPASNIHPTHELYSEFDPKKPIKPGESWPFKPKKVGTWKYHDHILPHIRGTIVVIAEEGGDKESNISFLEKIKNFFAEFITNLKSKFKFGTEYQVLPEESFTKLSAREQISVIQKLAKESEGKEAWIYIKDVFRGEPGSSGNIHDLAHLAGSLIYRNQGLKGLGKCSSEFAFGCYHGFLDAAFSESLDLLPEAHTACSDLGPNNSGPVASCIHGIGHGIASFHSAKDLKKSLSSCRKLTSGQEFCFDGVFMEFVRSASASFFKKDDPLYPCNMLEKEFAYTYSFACGRNQPSLLMGRFKMGFDEVIGVCLSSSSTPFKEGCFDALGFSLAATADVDTIVGGCQKIGIEEFVSRCIKSAAGELVFQEVPSWEEKSEAVCNAKEFVRDECLKHIYRLVSEYGKVKEINFTPIRERKNADLYLRRQLKTCYDMDGRDGCYKQAADVLYSEFGLSETLNLLKTNEQHKEVYARCHEVTHYLSRSEYEKQGSIAKVYSQCDSTCHGGCYHGTLEAYLKEKNLTGEKLAKEFARVCGKESDYQKPLEFNECLHGLGHAAMFVTEMELKESLELCDALGELRSRERCYTGVFMENSSSSTSFDHASIYIKADDPFYPCNSLEEKYLGLCWQYQSSYFAIISSQDWVKVADLCLQIPEKYQDRCFRTIGTNQVGFTPSLLVMKEDCDLMPSISFQNICVAGVISSLSYRFVGNSQKMSEFCSLVNLENKESCFRQMGTSLLDWSVDKALAKKECSKISDSQAVSWCMSAI